MTERRRFVAALACRNEGTRLFGKPMQRLDDDITILEQIIAALKLFTEIDEICLCVSEGPANTIFESVASANGVRHILGSPSDVLARLVQGGRECAATDIFRVTTECPFFDYAELTPAWKQHVETDADITVLDHVPEGTAFEIYSLGSLERSHREGTDSDRSEYCSNFARRNQGLFRINIRTARPEVRRPDLRLTVDYPEDLILCRAVYREFRNKAPLIPLEKVVRYLDQREELRQLVAPYVVAEPMWDRPAL